MVQDELSCPEYEITTEIRRGLLHQDQPSMEHLDQAHIQAAMESLEESGAAAYVLETGEGGALLNTTEHPANSSEATVVIPFEGSLAASIVPENSLPVIETIVQPSNVVALDVMNASERVSALPQQEIGDESSSLTSPFPMETVSYHEVMVFF